jgi:hypothetical protein
MPEKSSLIKYHGLVSLFIGVGFLVVVQASAGLRFDYYAALPFFKLWLWFILYLALVAAYNKWYLRQIAKSNPWKIVMFSLLLLSGLGLFLVIPTAFTRGFFLIISIPIIALFEATIGDFSENFLVTQTLFSALGAFAGFGGWAFLYTPQARFYLASAVFIYVFLLARSFFEYAPRGDKPKLISGLAIAFLTASFVMLFVFALLNGLPFGILLLKCHAIASPSRSRSLARNINSAFFSF